MGTGRNIRLMVTGGGTGGHLFPGIAVAEALLDQYPASKVMFVGTNRLLDARALAGRKFETATIVSHGLKGKSLLAKMGAIAELPLSLLAATGIIRKFRPDVVMGVGGYVTGPVALAARIMGSPTCIHEQNSVPGLANRMLGKFVDRIFVSLPGSEKYFPESKTIMTGNPVRRELLRIVKERREMEGDKVTLLVLGGSQGAHRLNTLVTGAARKYKKEFQESLKIIHQTGSRDEKTVADSYRELDIEAKVYNFIDDMANAYQQADFLVSRAGATTLAEITALKKAAILVPYPYAADNHQAKNALFLVKEGAAVGYLEEELTDEKLGKEIMRLTGDKKLRQKMSAAAGKLGKPKATETIMEQCFALAGQGHK